MVQQYCEAQVVSRYSDKDDKTQIDKSKRYFLKREGISKT